MARKRRFRFGLLIAFAGRPSVGGSALAVSQFGSLRRPGSVRSAVYCLTAYCLIQKARGGFSGAGSSLCYDERMPVICPARQIIYAKIAERRERVK